MGTPTYELLSETVLGSSAASVTFSSVSQAYKDLVLEVAGQGTAANTWGQTRTTYNSDTGTNYSVTYMQGNGSSAGSGRSTSQQYWDAGFTFSGGQSSIRIYLMSYSNASIYKTALSRADDAGTQTTTYVSLWRSTAAINSIALAAQYGNFASGSTFRLYGIRG